MAHAAIKLNGVTLPPQMIAAEAQHHPARTPAAAFQAAARAPEMIAEGNRETLDEVKVRQLLERCVAVHNPSEAECRAYHQSHAAQFHSPELVEASHILFAVDPRDSEAPAKAQSAARSALAELSHRPDLFESLAQERSDCSSKSSGGRLGQLAAGDTVSEFEAALSSLQAGEITSAPVRTRFGFHIIRLDARIAGKPLPFSYVQDRIAAYLTERQWRHDAALFIARLVDGAKIEGVDMKGGAPA